MRRTTKGLYARARACNPSSMRTSSIEIRRARKSDAAGIATVHDAAWRYAYRGVLPGAELERMIARRGPDWWHKAISRRVSILVLDVEEKIRGYVTFGASRARSLPFRSEIYELYIQPEYMGIGFGSQLFRAAQSKLARAGQPGLVVWSLVENQTACSFYSRLGGRPVATAEERFCDVLVPKVAFGFESRKRARVIRPDTA